MATLEGIVCDSLPTDLAVRASGKQEKVREACRGPATKVSVSVQGGIVFARAACPLKTRARSPPPPAGCNAVSFSVSLCLSPSLGALSLYPLFIPVSQGTVIGA